ncbi:hypothetical protein HYU22_01110 [Candidatus Woesearchaeota archaeon]|nr:hypothetical protein [Candidatus Woesearchaeota archaeon]
MRWRFFIALVLLVLSSSFVLAQSTIDVTPLDYQITTAEEASFEVTVSNTENVTRVYTLYGLDAVWGVDVADRKFSLNPEQSKTTTVRVKPLGPFQPSTYAIKLYVDASTPGDTAPVERYQRDLTVVLYPEQPVEYLPSIGVTVDVNEKISPRNPLSIKLFLENRNPLNLAGMTVRIESDIPEFAQDAVVDLPPREQKTVEFSITPNPYQQPREYTLFFVFERNGETIKVVEKKIEILPLLPGFRVEPIEETIFLKKFTQVRITNEGNVLNTQDVKVPVSLPAALFTSGVDVGSEQGRFYLHWSLALRPNESTTIEYVTNYRILLYIIVLLALFGLFYWAVQPPVQVRKHAVAVKAGEDGTLSELKVTLEVRNRSRRQLKNIVVTDIVPSIANVTKNLELGTLKPLEIKETHRGTKISWSLPELDGHEHRIITYALRTKLNVLGDFSLPRATIEYGKRRGKVGKAYSNIFRLSS